MTAGAQASTTQESSQHSGTPAKGAALVLFFEVWESPTRT